MPIVIAVTVSLQPLLQLSAGYAIAVVVSLPLVTYRIS